MNKLKHLLPVAGVACTILAMAAAPDSHQPMPDVNQVIDNTPDSINKARTARPVAGSTRVGNNPVLFLVGNSTMRTGTLGNGSNGQWGWGYYAPEYFDKNKITVENHALGGMSSRTFYNVLWKDVLAGVKKGDWVIIELGHNDNGPFDSGRARATIRGIGDEVMPVVIKETGARDTVYSYGEYMRRYVREVKAKGAHPILFSLTPRMAWDDKDSTKVTRVNQTFGLWAKQVAEAEGVPFVDLNDITATKFEKFGKDKVKTMFYIDRIHTSEFGAKVNARSAAEGIAALENCELKDYLLPFPVDTITGSSRKPGKPILFTIGDSTVKNEDNSDDSMWGWGSVISELFNPEEITVENHAMAGRSARTFLDEGRWDKVYNALQPGDFVLMQFGHNDGGDINTGKARGELHGSGPESKVFKMEKTGINQVVYTYGWYIRKFIMDCKEKGAIPIVLSHTPRNKWKDGKIESNADSYGQWAKDAAVQAGAYYIDLNAISGKKYQAIGEENTPPYFKKDHTHSSKKGARLNAASIAEGLRGTDCPLKGYLLPVAPQTFTMDTKTPAYNDMDGYGYDFGTAPSAKGDKPYFFSMRVPDGNYMVTVKLGDKKRKSSTMVRAENRRMMLDEVSLPKKKSEEYSFVVNKRSPQIDLKNSVRLNPREVGVCNWDDKLTIEVTGKAPAMESITIRPVEESDSVTTLFYCGDSTVVDQANEPYASWGQLIPQFFDTNISVSNQAESGQRTSSFFASKRYDKVLSMAKPGDYVFVEFGHNDEKDRGAGSGAYYNFAHNLKTFIDRARAKGLNVVFLTPTARRNFKNGKLQDTHGDYPKAMREVAARENVPLIDLTEMTSALYESLGEEGSKRTLVHYPAGTYPGQDKDLADNTHFNPFGADQVARCVREGIAEKLPELAKHLKPYTKYSPTAPDDPDSFNWPLSTFVLVEKPLGN